jgi:hypothetical protein
VTFDVLTLRKMTLSPMIFRIATLSISTFDVMTISIVTIIIRVNKFSYKFRNLVFCVECNSAEWCYAECHFVVCWGTKVSHVLVGLSNSTKGFKLDIQKTSTELFKIIFVKNLHFVHFLYQHLIPCLSTHFWNLIFKHPSIISFHEF